MDKSAFTLLEVLVVIIIIGILATIGLVNYTGVKEHALGKEAQSNLKLIAAAEKIYRLETTAYYISSTLANINANLKLALPAGSAANWNYAIRYGSTGDAASFNAIAGRAAGPYSACTYVITNDDADGEPDILIGTCP